MSTQTHTLETLAKYLVEDGDCLIWTGGYTAKGATPTLNDGGRTLSARWKVALLNGHPLAVKEAAGQLERGFWRHTCGNQRCVSPDHAKRVTRTQHMQELTRISNTGTVHAIKVAKITATKRLRSGKIAAEDIQDILSADTGVCEEARKRGVHPSIISRLRTRDTTKAAGGVFSGLGART